MLPARLVTVEEGLWQVFLPIPPVPASRPRVGRWGTYYSKTYKTWKDLAELLLKEVTPLSPLVSAPVFVTVSSVTQRPKTVKLLQPSPDVDNYAKAPLDAITKAQCLWLDDKQVVMLVAAKRYADVDETPHTFIQVGLRQDACDPVLCWVTPKIGEDVFDLPPDRRVNF